jgi:hypothetical protein
MKLIASLANYLAAVERIWLDRSAAHDHIAAIWFRGHPDTRWELVPGAYRSGYDHISEHRLRHEFVLRAQPFIREATVPPKDHWDWYFLMQHYGLPTRLLDWSESALVALYFAVKPGSLEDQPGCVWILDPRSLNIIMADAPYVPIYSDVMVQPYLPTLWDEDTRLPEPPLAIDPPHNSPRLAAQHGKFTVHGDSRLPLSKQKLRRGLVRLDIPHEAKGPILRQLLSAGITEAGLFPGLSGLAAELRYAYSVGFQL